jgi:DNA-nicking Smr family endonuclease
MKRPLRPDELNLWARVAATVHPAPGRRALPIAPKSEGDAGGAIPPPAAPPRVAAPRSHVRRQVPLEAIEPGRMRWLARDHDRLGPRLDLHGMDQDRARAMLTDFLLRARDDGWRAVLVITGKGSRGDGVLRRMTPEWLAGPELRDLVSGVSEAHRRHGGEGALYVALKRRPRV